MLTVTLKISVGFRILLKGHGMGLVPPVYLTGWNGKIWPTVSSSQHIQCIGVLNLISSLTK